VELSTPGSCLFNIPLIATWKDRLSCTFTLDKASTRYTYLDKAELQEVKRLLSAFLLSKEYKEAEVP
jgi:hypothetical protein